MDTCHENLQSYTEEIQNLVVRLENEIPELQPIRALVPVSNSLSKWQLRLKGKTQPTNVMGGLATNCLATKT
jgi:hypothetical protein